jgi:CubicO group peptidase (beta-lactamase class C family)
MSYMDRILRLIDDALAAGLGSAAAVSVGDGGAEVFRLVRGYVRRVPDRGGAIDAHTPFDLASVSKVVATATIAAQLAGEGALDVGAPVRAWFPEAATAGTVRDLLDHRAGCAAHVEFFRALRGARPERSYETLVERAATEPCDEPVVVASDGWRARGVYSDLGFILLGAILERAGGAPLDELFAARVAIPLSLSARYARSAITGAVATELDERGLVSGLVHDENCYYGGRVCGHAGLFGSLDDVARFAAAAVARGEKAMWLGWDTPSHVPGVSQAGDRWPREHAYGHTGFTGTSLWLDVPRKRWCALLTNRVHPTRFGTTADAIKTLRRAVSDAVVEALA